MFCPVLFATKCYKITRHFKKLNQEFLTNSILNSEQTHYYSMDVKMDLILDTDQRNHPQCPHGPTFLFKKSDGERRTSRKFFACSANRNRKHCSFFHWYDEPITPQKRKTWETIARQHFDSLNLNSLRSRQSKLQCCSASTRLKLCKKCSLLLFPNEWSKHSSHGHLEEVTHAMRMKPTTFLPPLEENKSNAQYFFSDDCVKFIVESLVEAGIKKVLGVGVPRILEHIFQREDGLECLLMDIDHRYAQFYNNENFILYNLFNHHFFEGPSSQKTFLNFVRSPERIALVIDPPFGGMVSAIAHTVMKISKCRADQQIPVVFFFPYFNEDRVLREMPTLKMLDYKVDYVNHGKFKDGKSKQGSVVRLYTNLDASTFVLPAEKGYRFCSICKRYVSEENKHCEDCDSCTSKDGKPYNHCHKCGRCVKSSWEHCPVCNKCVLPEHSCQATKKRTSNDDEHPSRGKNRKQTKR